MGDLQYSNMIFLMIAWLKIEKDCEKKCIVVAKSAMFLVMFDVSEWARTELEIFELNK